MYPNLEFQEPLYLELSHFVKCVQQRTEPLTGIEESINVLEIIEAAYESSRSDQTVILDTRPTTERRR